VRKSCIWLTEGLGAEMTPVSVYSKHGWLAGGSNDNWFPI